MVSFIKSLHNLNFFFFSSERMEPRQSHSQLESTTIFTSSSFIIIFFSSQHARSTPHDNIWNKQMLCRFFFCELGIVVVEYIHNLKREKKTWKKTATIWAWESWTEMMRKRQKENKTYAKEKWKWQKRWHYFFSSSFSLFSINK